MSEICMGTMTFGSMADEKVSRAILDRALDAGVDFYDTAEIYPVPPDAKWVGRSEEILGSWMKGRSRDSLIIASKIAGPSGGWFVTPCRDGKTSLDRHAIEHAVEDSLRRLGTDYIDLYQTHWPDHELPFDEVLEGLDRVVEAGKVRYVGCSNENAWGLMKSLAASEMSGGPRMQTIQNNFSLVNRRFEDELALVCRREGVSLLPYSPNGGGVLSGKYDGGKDGSVNWPKGARFSLYREDAMRGAAMTARFVNENTLETSRRLAAVAEEAGMAPLTLATAWTLAKDFTSSTIIGATTVEQLDDTLAAAAVTLSFDVLAECDRITSELRYPMEG